MEPEEVGDEEVSNGEGNSEEEELESSDEELSFTEEDIEITDNMDEIKKELEISPSESVDDDETSQLQTLSINGQHSSIFTMPDSDSSSDSRRLKNGNIALQRPSPASSPKPIETRRKRSAPDPPNLPCPPKKTAPTIPPEDEDDCIILD